MSYHKLTSISKTLVFLLLFDSISSAEAKHAEAIRGWAPKGAWISVVLLDGSRMGGPLKSAGETTCVIQGDKSDIVIAYADIAEVKKIRPPGEQLGLTILIAAGALLLVGVAYAKAHR